MNVDGFCLLHYDFPRARISIALINTPILDHPPSRYDKFKYLRYFIDAQFDQGELVAWQKRRRGRSSAWCLLFFCTQKRLSEGLGVRG